MRPDDENVAQETLTIEPENAEAARDMMGVPDPIAAAIASTEPEPEHHLIADFKFNSGSTMQIKVPIDFDTDQFETAVGLLMQLRYAAEQRKAAMQPIIEVPKPPTLVAVDGRPIASREPH